MNVTMRLSMVEEYVETEIYIYVFIFINREIYEIA